VLYFIAECEMSNAELLIHFVKFNDRQLICPIKNIPKSAFRLPHSNKSEIEHPTSEIDSHPFLNRLVNYILYARPDI